MELCILHRPTQRSQMYQPTIGEELKAVAQDHRIKTHPQENAHRRTILLTCRNGSWGFTLQSYGIHHKKRNEVELLTYVDYVELGGPACIAGMRQGDVILSINGVSMETASHQTLVSYIKTGGDTMRMVVLFENCFKKVELHLRYLKLKKLQAEKEFEMRSVEEKMKRIMLGKCLLDPRRLSLASSSGSSANFWDDRLSLRPDLDVCPSPLAPRGGGFSSPGGSIAGLSFGGESVSPQTDSSWSTLSRSPAGSMRSRVSIPHQTDAPRSPTSLRLNLCDNKTRSYLTVPGVGYGSLPSPRRRRPASLCLSQTASGDVSLIEPQPKHRLSAIVEPDGSCRPASYAYSLHAQSVPVISEPQSEKCRTCEVGRPVPMSSPSSDSDGGSPQLPLRRNTRSRHSSRSMSFRSSFRASFRHSIRPSSGDLYQESCNYVVTEDNGVVESEPELVRWKYGDVDLTNVCREANSGNQSNSTMSQQDENNLHNTQTDHVHGSCDNNGNSLSVSSSEGATIENYFDSHPGLSDNGNVCVRYSKENHRIQLDNLTHPNMKESLSVDKARHLRRPSRKALNLSLRCSPRTSSSLLTPATTESTDSFAFPSDCSSAGDPFDDSSPATNSPPSRNDIAPFFAPPALDAATKVAAVTSLVKGKVRPNKSHFYSRHLNTACVPSTLMYINEEDEMTRL